MPARSLRTTRSQTSVRLPTSSSSRVSSISPAARNCAASGDAPPVSPRTMRALWQVTQYRSRTSR